MPAKRSGAARAAVPDEPDEAGETRTELQFGPLSDLCGYWVRKAYSKLFATFNAMLRELDIAPGQYSVLTLIGLNPGTSQMALADATGIDRSTIVPIIDRFVRMGWVRRSRRRDDRRVYSLRLTPAGQALLDQARPIIARHEELLVKDLDASERVQLSSLLRRVVDSPAFDEILAGTAKTARRGRKAAPEI